MTTDSTKEELVASGITLEVGQKAKIILKQNLSTGYGWEINEEAAGDVFDIKTKNKNGINP